MGYGKPKSKKNALDGLQLRVCTLSGTLFPPPGWAVGFAWIKRRHLRAAFCQVSGSLSLPGRKPICYATDPTSKCPECSKSCLNGMAPTNAMFSSGLPLLLQVYKALHEDTCGSTFLIPSLPLGHKGRRARSPRAQGSQGPNLGVPTWSPRVWILGIPGGSVTSRCLSASC